MPATVAENGEGEFEMEPKNPNYLRDIIERLERVYEAEKDFELNVRLGGLLNHAREVRDYATKERKTDEKQNPVSS